MLKFLNRFGFGGGADYDTIEKQGARKPRRSSLGSVDQHLPENQKKKAIGQTRDLQRNASTAAWAIRKHLDYVTRFRFRPNTGDEKLDEALKNAVDQWSKKGQFESSGRHNLDRGIRLLESSRTIDGDIFGYKLRDGRMQFIESDRMQNKDIDKSDIDNRTWVQGLLINNNTGKVEKYRVCRRGKTKNSFEFIRDVNANLIIPLAYYTRFDQVRGVSPLMAALNNFQDNNDGLDLALAKLKVAQMFGMVFYRTSAEGFPEAAASDPTIEIVDGETSEVEDTERYDVNLGKGPFTLDLDTGDRAEFLKSDINSTDTKEILQFTIDAAIKALDLPFSFYDESHTNFFGSRGAILAYKKSCQNKQSDIKEWLDEWLQFRIDHSQASGLWPVISDNAEKLKWEWVADGIPWWDTAKESRGAASMIAMCLDNYPRVAKEIGTDFYENIKINAQCQEKARLAGFDLTLPGVVAGDVSTDDDSDNNQDKGTNNEKEPRR